MRALNLALIVLGLTELSPWHVFAPSQVLTLDEAVKTAKDNNRSIRVAQLERKKALDEVHVARAYRLPTFSVTALGSQSLSHLGLRREKGALGNFASTGPIPAATTTLQSPLRVNGILFANVAEPLSQQHRIGLGIQLARVGVEVADEEGDDAKQKDGFGDLVIALSVSVFAIFLALVMQFNHAVKPLLVFAAVPFGVVRAAAALFVMHTAFGFMAFLGITSLIGVIVSHVIVLFDFIEEMHERGEPLEQALADAGIVRLRPVLITVGATVPALFPVLFPLPLHGGPLCYAQIGGLFAATFITLLLVPVLYAIFVLDLKVVKSQSDEQALTEMVKEGAAT
jgi:hypothetical protein